MKLIIYILCIIAVAIIVVFLNLISEGNAANIGLGDFIVKLIGYMAISHILEKNIWKK